MIGVVARDEERPWVREFFELFKTPWEYYRAEGRYSVLLCAADAVPENAPALVLVFGSTELRLDRELNFQPRARVANVMLVHNGERLPVYGHCLTFGPGVDAALRIANGGGLAMAHARVAGRDIVRFGFDLFREVRHLLTQGQPPANAVIPALELHIELVRKTMLKSGVAFVEIPPVPAGHAFIACLTHDMDHPAIRHHGIDHTTLGFLERATLGSVLALLGGRMTAGQVVRNWFAALKLPFVHLGLARDFWRQTGRYLELERGLGSTFFVVPTKHYAGRDVGRNHSARRATQYEAADIAPDLHQIIAADGEVGVHGIDAWLDAESGQSEQAKVSSAAGCSSEGVRMHWLCFNTESPAALEAAGFGYDSTVGYNECVGYRAGTLQVFRPSGVERLLELPLHVMDTALFYPTYLNLPAAAAAELVKKLVRDAARFGGVLTVNWHDRSLAPERLWDGFYVNLLGWLRRDGAWCPTAGRAVGWFRKRRAAVIERVVFENDGVRIRATLPSSPADLPGLILRIHQPPVRAGAAAAVVDVPFTRSLDEVIGLQN